MLLLILLLALAGTFGLDVVLGAFIAGIIVRRFSPPTAESVLQGKIEAIGFGFLIPLFFVVSGANLDIVSIIENPVPMLRFFAYILVARGSSSTSSTGERSPTAASGRASPCYVATGLPIIVAVTSIEVQAGVMIASNAAALVGAGALTVLVFPLVGDRLVRGRTPAAPDQERAENTV